MTIKSTRGLKIPMPGIEGEDVIWKEPRLFKAGEEVSLTYWNEVVHNDIEWLAASQVDTFPPSPTGVTGSSTTTVYPLVSTRATPLIPIEKPSDRDLMIAWDIQFNSDVTTLSPHSPVTACQLVLILRDYVYTDSGSYNAQGERHVFAGKINPVTAVWHAGNSVHSRNHDQGMLILQDEDFITGYFDLVLGLRVFTSLNFTHETTLYIAPVS